jgi:DNA repair photolyase
MTDQQLTDDLLEQQDPYEFHMRREKKERTREGGVDPETGWRYEFWNIGMTRNAKAENRKEMKVFLDPVPHVVLDQNVPLRGWYKPKHEAPGKRPRPCYTEAILTQPYGGFCHVGCGFCYINNGVRGYRGQGVSTVDPNYPKKVRRQLKRMRTGAAVYMSSFIDPFLELEDYYKNTRGTAEAAAEVGLPMFFLTRKKVPGWAYDLLKQNAHSYMQFSINTSDPEDWRRLSPRALPLPDMLDQIREMRLQGIYVSIQVNPIVAGITSNDQIVELIHMLAQAGADHLIFKFVEIVFPSAPSMVAQMRARFGDERANRFEGLFTQAIGGVYTIQEEYRIRALHRFKEETKKAGVTMGLCYEYKYERDAAGQPINKVGVSMGAEFLTADQCHGHRVPIYSRESAEESFKPIDGCPPSGCLTCADERETVPCNNDFLAEARALSPQDLNRVAYIKPEDIK